MNKTTIKISVLAFLGFMTYGYAQQQQQDPYKGKVGVNTIEPSATMDIRPSTANAQKEATTNEGIIAPKLSKTRIANIATPVEGTLVYATDDATSPISAYTGNDPKVAKITEKGYYFYNGTEWAKSGESIWKTKAQDDHTVAYLNNSSGGIELRGGFSSTSNKGVVGVTVYSYSDAYQFSGGFGTSRSRGTESAPQAVRKNDNLLTIGAGGHDSDKNIFNASTIFAYAGENWAPTNHSSSLEFHVTNGLQRSRAMKIAPNGSVLITTGGATGLLPTEKLEVHGSIKSTALAGTGNRPVYADAEGKLIIGNSTTIRAAWVPDTASNSVQLAITSANGDRTTHPISITDEGMVRATSFQGVNGATIFPDYVFQKYYTGTSSIKADYNFKSLSQVEDFVKTNGHLPGYKSAATIKAQGYVDLMETQLTNVEKIEELYLHSIEQDKVNKQQAEALRAKDAEIADLKQRLERLEKLIQ